MKGVPGPRFRWATNEDATDRKELQSGGRPRSAGAVDTAASRLYWGHTGL
jgi:hypothetical protein